MKFITWILIVHTLYFIRCSQKLISSLHQSSSSSSRHKTVSLIGTLLITPDEKTDLRTDGQWPISFGHNYPCLTLTWAPDRDSKPRPQWPMDSKTCALTYNKTTGRSNIHFNVIEEVSVPWYNIILMYKRFFFPFFFFHQHVHSGGSA